MAARTPLALSISRGRGRTEVYMDALQALHAPAPRARRAACKLLHALGSLRDQGLRDGPLRAFLQRYARQVLAQLGPTRAQRQLFWSVMWVAPGAAAQGIHADDWLHADYTTVLVPLTAHPRQGTTYFPRSRARTFAGTVAYAFGGKVLHYGTANESEADRVALMAVVVNPAHGEPNRVTTLVRPFA